uniref:Uncharacterized protein n=1 Tax=Anguilla anguilla TaxID=7936 RepID=A0A0E9UGS2_ANGAN
MASMIVSQSKVGSSSTRFLTGEGTLGVALLLIDRHVLFRTGDSSARSAAQSSVQ